MQVFAAGCDVPMLRVHNFWTPMSEKRSFGVWTVLSHSLLIATLRFMSVISITPQPQLDPNYRFRVFRSLLSCERLMFRIADSMLIPLPSVVFVFTKRA